MSEDKTLRIYDAKAADYARLVEDFDHPALAAFIAALPAGGRVLDLGCGPGHVAAHLADAGFQVDATDGSAEMVRLAALHPGVTARQARFDQIEGTDLYDGLWASFSLLHAPRADFPGHLAALHRAAKPGARLMLGMKTGTGEATDALGRFYAYYSAEELDAALSAAGFTVTGHRTGEANGLAGGIEPYVEITAHA